MLRFSFLVTKMDKIRNEDITRTAKVGGFRDIVRDSIVRWFEHVQWRDSKYMLVAPQDGATRQEAKRKIIEEIHECGERGHADSWREKRIYRGQGAMEENDSLWWLLEIFR